MQPINFDFLKYLNNRNKRGETPLLLGCRVGSNNCLPLLLSKGASLLIPSLENKLAYEYCQDEFIKKTLKYLTRCELQLLADLGCDILKHKELLESTENQINNNIDDNTCKQVMKLFCAYVKSPDSEIFDISKAAISFAMFKRGLIK